ncbi:transcriptional regulator [Longispora fulva]|uniref:DUF5753 domain-containing protein n=1 Tax=Longispora fulva TaxID=619741 RepID=A0A8J7GX75_9ACTN|nr:helix-turn-helix transcriptional regulator [Longispora fulva]MBG6139606.1 hypothetical protein [Longispora fulva]GIG58011.1 transcriptional regulator [Longispora fulva]
MTQRLDPKEARRHLGLGLRKIRDTADITLDVAADRLSRTEGWLSKVERGHSRITPGEVEILLGLYGADSEVIDTMRNLASQAGPNRSSAMYRQFSDVIDADFDPLLRLEAAATTLRWWGDTVIPALLQIRDYSHRIVGAGVRRVAEGEIAKLVDLRMSRQRILASENSPAVTCVIAEGALLQIVGGPEVMTAQLDHLIATARAGTVDIRVLPFEAGAHPALNGAFVLVTMPPLPAFIADGPEVVAYQDTVLGSVYHREADEVGVYEAIWQELLKAALPKVESERKLNTIREQIGSTT